MGTNIYITKVLSVDDNYKGNRIKVKISPFDNVYKSVDDLPYCFPLLPKMFHVLPKVNETVLVFLQNNESATSQRFYIGPVISQDYFIDFDAHDANALSLLGGRGIEPPLPNPDMDDLNKGTLPKDGDLSIKGRGNSDIQLKDSELLLRCGHKKNPNSIYSNEKLVFNDNDFGYVQLKYDDKFKGLKDEEYSSVVNVVADRINLLTHDSPDGLNLITNEELMDNNDLLEALKKSHKVVYGDLLINYLEELIRVFRNHTHPFPMLPPTFNDADTEVLNTDLKQFLSETIKVS